MAEPGSLVIVDLIELKIYGIYKLHLEKHSILVRRTWSKLHLAVDETYKILTFDLTTPKVSDSTAVPDLLEQIETPFDVFMDDDAYDGEPALRRVLTILPDAKVVVPLHNSAVLSAEGDTQRDSHIRVIDKHGQIGRQKKTSYELRSYIELAIQRYKGIIGNCMKARACHSKRPKRGSVRLH